MALTLSHYRFGVDELAESTHGWYAAEDTDPAEGDIPLDTTFLLRFCVQANATGLSNVDNEFQYRINGGTWTNITTTSTNVRAVAATALTNGSNCTKRLSGTGTFESTGAGQTEDGTSGGTANDIVASGNSETECGLQLRSADLTGGELVEFRLTRDGGTLLDTYAVVPSITIPVAAVNIDPALIAATTTVPSPSIDPTLDAPAISATTSVPNPVVESFLDIVRIESTATVSNPFVDPQLAAVRIESTVTVPSAVIDIAIDALSINSTVSVPNPEIVVETPIDAVRIESTASVPAPTVDVVLDAGSIAAGTTVFPATLNPSVDLGPPWNTTTVFEATLAVSIDAARIESTASVPVPIIDVGGSNIDVVRIESTSTVFSASFNPTLLIPLISAGVLYAPSIESGNPGLRFSGRVKTRAKNTVFPTGTHRYKFTVKSN